MNLLNLVSAVVCLCVWVFVFVNGQPTIEEYPETSDDLINKLVDTVTELRAELDRVKRQTAGNVAGNVADTVTELRAELNRTNDELAKMRASIGARYIRWGRKTCAGTARLVYKGYAAGPPWDKPGSGSNFLCLPENPQWNNYINGTLRSGEITGIQYDIARYSKNNIFSGTLSDNDLLIKRPAPCAVCYVEGRSTVLMVPARTQCPDGWTSEYRGYLVSDDKLNGYRRRSSYVCWDEAPEVVENRIHPVWQGAIFPVEVLCGSLPCSVYINGRELTCIVCSK